LELMLIQHDGVVFSGTERLRDSEMACWRIQTLRIDKQRCASREYFDFSVCCEGLEDTPEEKKCDPPRRLRISRDSATSDERFHLRSKSQRSPIVCIVERFDAIRITAENETTFLQIPQSKSKHATQMIDHLCAFRSVEMKQHLGIRLRAE